MSLEGPKKEKPKSSIDRVVGGSKKQEDKLFRKAAKVFYDQSFDYLKDKEREKTGEEKEILNLADELTNGLLREYGVDDFTVPLKNIHIIPEAKWIRGKSDGVYNAALQGVAMQGDFGSRVYFLAVAVHELLHLKSHNALQIKIEHGEKEDPVGLFRVGLKALSRDGKQAYFTELNEAVTEELNKRILTKAIDSLKNNHLFSDEIKNTTELGNKYSNERSVSGRWLFNEDTIYARTIPTLQERKVPLIQTYGFTYRKQRKMLNSLVEKVFIKNKDKFKDQKEVFDFFVKAYLSGNMLPMGRLIEETFGKGSFRKIGKLDMGTKKVRDEKKPEAEKNPSK